MILFENDSVSTAYINLVVSLYVHRQFASIIWGNSKVSPGFSTSAVQ
jgi:hypothetical protein